MSHFRSLAQSKRTAARELAIFSSLLADVVKAFGKTIHLNIFMDDDGSCIAFNQRRSIFCNVRYFIQVHLKKMEKFHQDLPCKGTFPVRTEADREAKLFW